MRFLLMALILAATLFAWSPSSGPAPASASGVTAVATGRTHSCAMTTEGGVKCWGQNNLGQLGNGTTIDSIAPVDVMGLTSGVAAISAGNSHTCALTTAGGVKCWGYDSDGKLGYGTRSNFRATPVGVVGLTSGVTAVAAGGDHTCAITTAGGVKCWGANNYGQIGDGRPSTGSVYVPVDVVGLTSGVVDVSAAGSNTCAVTSTGSVKCWGGNDFGQLGSPITETCFEYACSSTPIEVSGLASGVVSVEAGGRHSCSLTSTGGVQCWGYNAAGQLGDGTTVERTVPMSVVGLNDGVAAVTAGSHYTCALTTSGGVKCWGINYRGALGDGQSCGTPVCAAPVDVSGLTSGVAHVDAGLLHTCAVTTEGRVKCWGLNEYGQLGTESGDLCANNSDPGFTTPCSTTPVEVVGLGPKPIPTPCPSEGCPTPTPTPVLTPAPPSTPTPDEPQPTPPASAVVLDFDTYPGGDWELASSGGSSYVSGGILTIDSPTFTNPYTPSGEPRLSFINAFSLRHPDGVWHQEVSNSRGWAVEARLRVAPSSNESCGNDLLIWMYDHDRLVKVGFGTNEVCFISPDIVRYPMDTTDGFHVYRVEVQLDNAKVYVDGDLVIDHILSQTGVGSSDVLMFGDGAGGDAMSLSYWDYFWYDVAPDMTPDEPQPTPTPVPTSAPTPDEPQATPAPVRGDANCDSITDAIDAALILQYVAGLFASLACPENADATLDGNINSVDALFVLQMVAGMFNECCAGLPDFPPDVLPQPTDTPVPTESRPERSNCHPSYHGVCLDPNALDYDCAGGTGNGPRWVEGPITVVGPDKFGLDRDGDGVGCE